MLARIVLRPALLAQAGCQAVSACEAAVPGAVAAATLCPQLRFWSSTPSDDALKRAEKMIDLMSKSPQMQQMIMSVMPAPMRNPEMVRRVFESPEMRQKMAEMMASRGFTLPDNVLERFNPESMGQTLERAQRMGLNPSDLFSKLMAHPGLLAKLKEPRIMTAFLEISQDPSQQAKYEDDKELLEVVFKVREILSTQKPAQAAAEVASSSEAAGPSVAGSVEASPAQPAPPPPGQPPAAESAAESVPAHDMSNPLVAMLASDPVASKWLGNPRVMAAIEEVQKSPWKTLKYIFDREVMEAFKDLKDVMKRKPT